MQCLSSAALAPRGRRRTPPALPSARLLGAPARARRARGARASGRPARLLATSTREGTLPTLRTAEHREVHSRDSAVRRVSATGTLCSRRREHATGAGGRARHQDGEQQTERRQVPAA